MERTRFLQHYRVRVRSDGTPYEVDRNGAAVTYEAVDERTAEPVSLKLIPVQSIDAAVREQFEEQISTAQKLRHVNIAKVFDFGREGSDFVYVSEHLPGETLAAWVRSHGPMRADAALRVAEQIVSVLSSASFHKLPLACCQIRSRKYSDRGRSCGRRRFRQRGTISDSTQRHPFRDLFARCDALLSPDWRCAFG